MIWVTAEFGVPAMIHTPSSSLLLIASAAAEVSMYSALISSSVLPMAPRCTLASSTVVEPAAPMEIFLPIRSSRPSMPEALVTTTWFGLMYRPAKMRSLSLA